MEEEGKGEIPYNIKALGLVRGLRGTDKTRRRARSGYWKGRLRMTRSQNAQIEMNRMSLLCPYVDTFDLSKNKFSRSADY